MTQLVIILEFQVDAIRSLIKWRPHLTDVDFLCLVWTLYAYYYLISFFLNRIGHSRKKSWECYDKNLNHLHMQSHGQTSA